MNMATQPLRKVKCTITLAGTFFDQVMYERV